MKSGACYMFQWIAIRFTEISDLCVCIPTRNRGSATGFPHIQMEQNGCGGIGLKGIVEERAIELGNYILENKTTVRKAAKKFGVSKSTVHKDVSERLRSVNPQLYREVRGILEYNKAQRHIRGGMATRKKYCGK